MKEFVRSTLALLGVLLCVAGALVLFGAMSGTMMYGFRGSIGLWYAIGFAIGGIGYAIWNKVDHPEDGPTAAPDADGRIRSKQVPEKESERKGPRPGRRL